MLTNNVIYSNLRVVVEGAEEAFVGGFFMSALVRIFRDGAKSAREVVSDSYKRDGESSAPVLKLDAVVCAHDALSARPCFALTLDS